MVRTTDRFKFHPNGCGGVGPGRTLPKKTEKEIVDITQKLNTAMTENTMELYGFCDSYGSAYGAFYFAEKVKPGGDWDFKSQDDWNLNANTIYIYNGKELSYDDLGNIHYGYVGSVLFSESVLLFMGGAVQLYTRTSSWDYWDSYFDDPRDQTAISFGCKLWRNGL